MSTIEQRADWAMAAADNIDRNLADAVDGDLDNIQEHMYTLAHDGAVDAGATMEDATEIAIMLAGEQ